MAEKRRQQTEAKELVTRSICAGAASDVRLECSDSILVPLTGPAARYECGLIKGGEEHLELPAQIQHGSWGESADRKVKVHGTFRPGGRSARAFAKYMGLRPEPVRDRACTYLRVL